MNRDTDKWEYVNGGEGYDNSVQISPDGKFLLIKEITRNYKVDAYETKFRIVNIYDNESNKGKCDCQCSH